MPNEKIKETPIDSIRYQNLPDEDFTLSKGETSDFASREIIPQMIPGVSIPQADAAILLGSLGNFQIGRDFLTLGSGTSTAGLSGVITTGNDVRIFAGATHANRGTAPFRVHEDGSLVASSATITGSITATSGAIGGWTITATAITSGSVTLNSANEQILLGAATAPLTGIGIFIGKDGADYEIRAGNPAGSYMHWTGSAVNINGPVLTALASGSEIAIQDWSYTGAFSVTDLNTIAWAGGTLALMNGATYTITAANTGNMAAFTYIYLDISVSTTAFQVATSFTSGSGKILIATAQNGTAEASYLMMGGAGTYNIAGGNIAASSIIASKLSVSQLSAITADLGTITAGTVTGATIQTASSGARVVFNSTGIEGYDATVQRFDLSNDGSGWLGAATTLAWTTAGVVTAAGWTISTSEISSGNVKIQSTAERILMGAATAPLTGNGIFIGSDGAGAYDFRAGNPAGSYIHFDASAGTLAIQGNTVNGVTLQIGGTSITATATELNQVTDGVSANVTAANLNTLTAGTSSNADSLHVHRYAKILDVSTAQTTIQNTTTETTIFSASLVGGTLGSAANGLVEIDIPVSQFNINSGDNLTIRLKYGATTVVTCTTVNAPSTVSTTTKGRIRCILAGASSSEKGYVEFMVLQQTILNNSTITHAYAAQVGTAAENSATTLTLSVTVQWSAASANSILTTEGALGYIINAPA